MAATVKVDPVFSAPFPLTGYYKVSNSLPRTYNLYYGMSNVTDINKCYSSFQCDAYPNNCVGIMYDPSQKMCWAQCIKGTNGNISCNQGGTLQNAALDTSGTPYPSGVGYFTSNATMYVQGLSLLPGWAQVPLATSVNASTGFSYSQVLTNASTPANCATRIGTGTTADAFLWDPSSYSCYIHNSDTPTASLKTVASSSISNMSMLFQKQ